MASNMDNPGKRLIVLEGDEVEALYGLPCFTHEERIQYFALSPEEKAALDQLHSLKSTVYFILQLGYFKARRMFFIFGALGPNTSNTCGRNAADYRQLHHLLQRHAPL
jgi:hypothetical protein